MTKYLKSKFIDSSIVLSVIYTIGHIIIASICNFFITGAELELAALDALIEPIINGFWFYILHKFYKSYQNNKLSNLSSPKQVV